MKPTQKTTVLRHLQEHGEITSWDAINTYGITRLSEYIRQLRSEGYRINTIDTPVHTKNFGKTIIAKYTLTEEKQ